MPSGFDFIEHYNLLKEQIIREGDEEDARQTDQKVPQFGEPADILNSHIKSDNFISGLESGAIYLEELISPPLPQAVTVSPAPVSHSPHSQQSAHSQHCVSTTSHPVTMSQPSSQYTTAPFTIIMHCPAPTSEAVTSHVVDRMAGVGCTFTSNAPLTTSTTFTHGGGQQSPDHQLSPSPAAVLCDLDKHSSLSMYEDGPGSEFSFNNTMKMMEDIIKCEDDIQTRAYDYEGSYFGNQLMSHSNHNQKQQQSSDDFWDVINTLNIHQDPIHWSYTDTQRWVRYQASKCYVDASEKQSLYLFSVMGCSLLQMTREDFCFRVRSCGDFLYDELQKWVHTCKYYQSANINNGGYSDTSSDTDSTGPLISYEAYLPNDQTRSAPSISPAPSMDSTCSTLSSSSASGHSYSHEEDVYMSSRGGVRRQQQPFTHQTTLPNTTTAPITTTTTAHPGPRRHGGKQTIHLWQFLKELLDEPEAYHTYIRWTDRTRGIFKIEDSTKVAKLWGRRKNRPAMNYDKLSRSVRQYYKKGIIKKTEHSKRLVYQFCPGYL